jgi:hypothetical protein
MTNKALKKNLCTFVASLGLKRVELIFITYCVRLYSVALNLTYQDSFIRCYWLKLLEPRSKLCFSPRLCGDDSKHENGNHRHWGVVPWAASVAFSAALWHRRFTDPHVMSAALLNCLQHCCFLCGLFRHICWSLSRNGWGSRSVGVHFLERHKHNLNHSLAKDQVPSPVW